MQQRKLGWTDLNLTVIGLGTWAAGGGNWKFGWGPTDDRDVVDAIVRACENGINWIDTAPIYGLGHAEELVGQALQKTDAGPFVATKCGRAWDDDGAPVADLRPESIRTECEASLKRLGVEVIDLYQIHWPQPDAGIEDAWGTIADLVKEGKVRYAGVSNFDAGQIERVRRIAPVASLQPPYSMIVRGAEARLFDYCREHHIGIVTYSPLYKGLLTGAVTRERVEHFALNDHRRGDRQFQEPLLTKNLSMLESLKPVADNAGLSLLQLAVAWILRRPEVTSAIAGCRKPSHVEGILSAGDVALGEDVAAEIEGILQVKKVM